MGGSVQLKASGCRGRPLWVGLAEIRLNCWLREKISSVATPRCRWRCALPCASLCRRPRCPSRGYLLSPMRFTELRNYGRSVSINGAAPTASTTKEQEQFKENREWQFGIARITDRTIGFFVWSVIFLLLWFASGIPIFMIRNMERKMAPRSHRRLRNRFLGIRRSMERECRHFE